jgi:hypothetical protein
VKPLTIPQPYKATGTAGHPIEEWLEMTPLQQAEAHINTMRDTARKWAGIQWRESMGVPATVPADAQTLLTLCDAALKAIRDGDESAMLYAIKATAQAAELNRWSAIDKALALQRNANAPRSSGGKATATLRKIEAQTRCEEVASMYLALQSKAERDRTGVIAQRLGISTKTVLRHLKKAGIR